MDMTYLPHILFLVVVGGGLLALWIAAVVSILRSALVTPLVKALWILAILVFQFFGPIVWFAVSRYQRRHPAARDTIASV
jgi:hypothetical protein